jgi:hypothetical protein
MEDLPSYLNYKYVSYNRFPTAAKVVLLIQTAIQLMTHVKLENIIEGLIVEEVLEGNKSVINFTLNIHPQYKAMVFGRRFCNISSLRKLISNASGLDNIFYKLIVTEG